MNDVIKNEIGDMINLINAHTSAPGTEGAATEAPGTNAPGTEAPSTEAPGTESPGTEAPSTEAPTTEVPDEMEVLKTKNFELEERLKKLETPAPTKAPPTAAPTTDAPVSEVDFIGELDLEETTRDPKEFNKLLNSVLLKGIELGRGESRTAQEKTLRSIPEIVKSNIAIISALKKSSEKFYGDNKDLIPHKDIVAAVFEEQAAKNPDKKYDEVLKLVGTEVRVRIELKKQAEPKDKKKPNLPKNKGNKGQKAIKPETGSLVKELDEMNESLNT